MAEETLDQVRQTIVKHFTDQTYNEGLVYATETLKKHPEEFPLLNYWRICLTARLEAYDEANKMLEASLASGTWYSEAILRQSPSLVPMQDNPEFERLVEISLKMQAADISEKVPLLVMRPEDACGPGDEGCPLVLFLHGNQDTAQTSLPYWKDISNQGWLVALPQSKNAMWAGAYAWVDLDTTVQEMEEHFTKLAKQYAINPDQIIVGGFSMGAEMALAMALSGKINAYGFMLLGPGGPFMDDLDKWQELIDKAKGKRLSGVIWMGEADEAVPHDNIRKLAEMLHTGGFPTDLQTIPNLEHEYPADFDARLKKAIEFING